MLSEQLQLVITLICYTNIASGCCPAFVVSTWSSIQGGVLLSFHLNMRLIPASAAAAAAAPAAAVLLLLPLVASVPGDQVIACRGCSGLCTIDRQRTREDGFA